MFKTAINKTKIDTAYELAKFCAKDTARLDAVIADAPAKYKDWGKNGEAEQRKEIENARKEREEMQQQMVQALDTLEAAILQDMQDQVKADATMFNQDDVNFLNSGILNTSEELNGLVKTYEHNPTMLRVLQKYARDRGWNEYAENLGTTFDYSSGVVKEFFSLLRQNCRSLVSMDVITKDSRIIDRIARAHHFESFEDAMSPGWMVYTPRPAEDPDKYIISLPLHAE